MPIFSRDGLPLIPLPFAETRWFRIRYICACGRKFATEREYERHYVLTHVEPLDPE